MIDPVCTGVEKMADIVSVSTGVKKKSQLYALGYEGVFQAPVDKAPLHRFRKIFEFLISAKREDNRSFLDTKVTLTNEFSESFIILFY